MNSPAGSERTTLSRELGEFLIELSIAVNRTAMYPQGHPSQEEGAAVVVHRLATLLYDRPTLSIGVAQKQLVIEGVATDARNPVLSSLAGRLHEHHIGALVFHSGATPGEVLGALRLLAREPEKGALPLGLGHPELLDVGPRVRLYPLTFERLELLDADGSEESDDPDRARVAALWIGMARAAMADEGGGHEGLTHEQPAPTDPGEVAAAINAHPQAQAYDQVIVGYLLQIANELKKDGGVAAAAVRRRMSRLIGGLNEGTLDRLVQMGGDVEQRKRFLLDAADGMAADAVVELARAGGDLSKRPVTDSMMRILKKLSKHTEAGPPRARQTADVALRDQIRRLVADWTLDDPNPEAYTRALDAMAGHRQGDRLNSGTHPPEPMRVLQMAVELSTGGPGVEQAARKLLDSGYLADVMRVIEGAARSAATEAVWREIVRPEQILGMLAREPVDFPLLDRVIARADPAAVAGVLLDALDDEDSHVARSTLLRALGRLGPEVGFEAVSRLSSAGVKSTRQLLSLLNDLQVVPANIAPLEFARSEDPHVRREALQLAMRMPAERDRALALALTDADERVVRTGVRAAQSGVPDAIVALLARRAGDLRLPMDLRVNLVRALGGIRSPLVLDALLRVTTAGRTLFGRPRLAPRSPEMVAGIGVLADDWSSDRKAAAVLRRARRSADADVRSAAETA